MSPCGFGKRRLELTVFRPVGSRAPATPERRLIGLFDRLSRPLMRALDPEDAHRLALKALRFMPGRGRPADPPELAVRAFGLNFPNPVGIAPGFDKNAEAPDALLRLGFGFVEVGTVTPRAADRQSAAAPVSSRRRPGRDQPPRLQ